MKAGIQSTDALVFNNLLDGIESRVVVMVFGRVDCFLVPLLDLDL